MQYGKLNLEKLDNCNKINTNLNELNTNNEKIITGLEQDKKILKGISEDYKEKYIQSTENWIKEKENKPSRMVWFGLGALATSILITGLTILAK